MSEYGSELCRRRDFLKLILSISGVLPFAPGLVSAQFSFVAAPLPDPIMVYKSLDPLEGAVTEALVNTLCPGDSLTPDGVACGLAKGVDYQLSTAFGAADSTEPGMNRTQFYKVGIREVNMASQVRFGTRFDQLGHVRRAKLLHDVVAGQVPDQTVSLYRWYVQLVNPLLVQASFSGHVYEQYTSKVFWKLFA